MPLSNNKRKSGKWKGKVKPMNHHRDTSAGYGKIMQFLFRYYFI